MCLRPQGREKILIQTTKLQGLQIDPGLKLRIYAIYRRILLNKLTLKLSIQFNLSIQNRTQWGCRNPPYIVRGERQLKETKSDTKSVSKQNSEINSELPKSAARSTRRSTGSMCGWPVVQFFCAKIQSHSLLNLSASRSTVRWTALHMRLTAQLVSSSVHVCARFTRSCDQRPTSMLSFSAIFFNE